jgi:hypothetical protein
MPLTRGQQRAYQGLQGKVARGDSLSPEQEAELARYVKMISPSGPSRGRARGGVPPQARVR